MNTFKIAGVVFDAKLNFKRTLELCKNYLYYGDEPSEYSVTITKEDIERERSLSKEEGNFSDSYYEGLVVFRRLCEHILSKSEGLIFHCSALAVNGKAYLFTAPSGTGKSTHSRLWREFLGDRVQMVNDDKPILKLEDGRFYVYGTPWQGKHNLGENIRVEVGAVIELKRGKENSIEKINKEEMIATVFNQTIRPSDKSLMINLMELTDKFLRSVDTYRLYCNTDISAAKTAYERLVEGKNDKN